MFVINNREELDEFIINNLNNVILLYFGAKWCGPCEQLKQKLEEPDTKKRLPDLVVGYLDIDNNLEIVNNYKIESIPTQIFIKLNKHNTVVEISRIIGYDFTKLKLDYDFYKTST